jgi:hypothetical protein
MPQISRILLRPGVPGGDGARGPDGRAGDPRQGARGPGERAGDPRQGALGAGEGAGGTGRAPPRHPEPDRHRWGSLLARVSGKDAGRRFLPLRGEDGLGPMACQELRKRASKSWTEKRRKGPRPKAGPAQRGAPESAAALMPGRRGRDRRRGRLSAESRSQHTDWRPAGGATASVRAGATRCHGVSTRTGARGGCTWVSAWAWASAWASALAWVSPSGDPARP